MPHLSLAGFALLPRTGYGTELNISARRDAEPVDVTVVALELDVSGGIGLIRYPA